MRISRWLLLVVVGLFFLSSSADVEGARRSPPGKRDGEYKVTVAGYYSGQGSATIPQNMKLVSFQATVDTEDGGNGTLSATNLHIRDNHFSGTGTALGKQVQLDGRIDVPDGVGEEVQSARIVCNLESEDGHRGRIVGYWNAEAP
jgi:hypothetical protein